MRLTVAEKSGDMSARFVGECREVVDDDHVSVGRCAGDALQLGVVDRLTDTNLRHNHKHALACPTAEGGLVFLFNDFCYTICLNTCRTDPRRIFRIGSQTEVSFSSIPVKESCHDNQFFLALSTHYWTPARQLSFWVSTILARPSAVA